MPATARPSIDILPAAKLTTQGSPTLHEIGPQGGGKVYKEEGHRQAARQLQEG